GQHPLAFEFEELNSDCVARGRRFAIGDSRQRTETALGRKNGDAFAEAPASDTANARATRADVFGESGFQAGHERIPGDAHSDLYGQARFAPLYLLVLRFPFSADCHSPAPCLPRGLSSQLSPSSELRLA